MAEIGSASVGQQRAARRQPRGDLGDVGRNRGTWNDELAAEHVAPLPTLDESQIKLSFRNFVMSFAPTTAAEETRLRENDNNLQEDNEDDMDVDLENLGLPNQRTRRAGRRGNQSAQRSEVGFYLRALQRKVEGGNEVNDSSAAMNSAFPVDLQHVKAFDINLLRSIIHSPADAMVFIDETLSDIVAEQFPDVEADEITFCVCLYNHPRASKMRDLNPTDIEALVSISGVVIRASQIIPDMQTAAFRCTARVERNQMLFVCGNEESRQLANGEVQEPLQCDKCQAKFSFELNHSRCVFGNKQLLKIQETPESIPEGETPHTVMAYAYDELVDVAKPGDRVEVTGIFKAAGVRVVAKARNLKAVYRTYIDANHIKKDSAERLVVSEEELDGAGSRPITLEEFERNEANLPNRLAETRDGMRNILSTEAEEKMKALAEDPEIYKKLVKSLAPNIWEADDVKKGLLCQLFGGTPKVMGGKSGRGDVHVLLCGDPSTAKSQLLQYTNKLAPRGVYTCGRGTSAVGLTASVTRDPETREFVLESGAIVLSDRGICCIDEFDKMDDGARAILHEVMEQQTVSIAKAGIVCSLNARAAILASANPVNSRYDTRRSVVENINLPPTLLSRFDLIYLMLDNANEQIDRQLATHLCSLYTPSAGGSRFKPPIERQTFAQYVSYARRQCFPRLSEGSCDELTETYLSLRRQGADSSGKSLSATPRQLESLVRLSEGLARMRLDDTVRVDDVREAARLIQVATYNAIVDPVTGRIDFEQLNRGITGSARARREAVEKAICDSLTGESSGLDREALQKRVDDLLTQVNERPVDVGQREMETSLRDLISIGAIGRTHGGRYLFHK